MRAATSELILDDAERQRVYTVCVESGVKGVRLNITCAMMDTEEIENHQGVELSKSECRALAQMLNAAADLMKD